MVKYSKTLHDLLRDGSAEAFHDEVQALLDEIERLQKENATLQQLVGLDGTVTILIGEPFRKSYTREGIENQFQADA